jgi:hypothetical protein
MRGAVLPAGNRLRRLWHAVEVSVVALEAIKDLLFWTFVFIAM